MVLSRQPKKYKHFIKILTSQLMIYENIQTTSAKVLRFFIDLGQTSQKSSQSFVELRKKGCQRRNIRCQPLARKGQY